MMSALQHFVDAENISVVTLTSRVKDFDSFIEKTERKSYIDPFDENEDFVGIRIITYFPDDVEKIARIIDDELDVQKTDDKFEALEDDQFGYRSVHKIATAPKSWLSTPNYRGLDSLKCEIQIRTLLMHAWAEVEHKLQYKNKASVPRPLRRKLFQLCAKFEEADEQFQVLRDGVEKYREEITSSIEGSNFSSDNIEINSETLSEYLNDRYKGERRLGSSGYSELVGELISHGYNNISQLDKELNRASNAFDVYELEDPPSNGGMYLDVGAVRMSLAITNKNYREAKDYRGDFSKYEELITT